MSNHSIRFNDGRRKNQRGIRQHERTQILIFQNKALRQDLASVSIPNCNFRYETGAIITYESQTYEIREQQKSHAGAMYWIAKPGTSKLSMKSVYEREITMTTQPEVSGTSALAIQSNPYEIIDVDAAIQSVQSLKATLMKMRSDNVLVRGVDYGEIPGTGADDVLFLPGMEKICRALRLRPEYVERHAIRDYKEGIFHFEFECRLVSTETGQVVPGGVGVGACTSWEASFRWRWMREDELPYEFRDKKETLVTRNASISEFKFAVEKAETQGKYGKPAEYWQRFDDAIANGTARLIKRKTKSGKEMDAWEIGGVEYQIQNPNIFSELNSVFKRGKKRALADAVKGAANASEFFTVDLEDMVDDYSKLQAMNARPIRQPGVIEAPKHWAMERLNKKVIVTNYSNLKNDGMAKTDAELWEEVKSLLPEEISFYATGKEAWAAIKSAYKKQQETKPAEPKSQTDMFQTTTEHGHVDVAPPKTDDELLADMKNQNATILDDEVLTEEELAGLGMVPADSPFNKE